MQATTSTRDPHCGVSPFAPDNNAQRDEFYRLGLAGNHDEVRRRLAEAEDRARRHIWLRGMERRAEL